MRFAAVVLISLSLATLSRVATGQVQPGSGVAAQASSSKRSLEVDDYFRIKEVHGAQISPEGKWVAYTVETHDLQADKNKSRIWMVPTAGGEAIPLTAESVSSSRPRWSPDGKYLAFLSARGQGEGESEGGNRTQVWILHREGGEAQQLTETMQDVGDFEWSPSGDRLALTLQDPTPDELEAAKNGGGAKTKPKPRPWVIDRLHFKEDEIGYLDRRRTHLYVFTLADHKLTQVTSGDYDDSEPAWSPDGRSLAFTSNRTANPDSNFNSSIWTVAADNTDQGKNLVRVTTGATMDDSPTWSPDGKWIAFTRQLDLHLMEYATFHLAVAPAGGGDAKVLTRALDRNVSAPRFCPNGKWIYFIADDDGTQNLMLISAGGGEITRPIGGRPTVYGYSVSEDGAVAAQSQLSRPDEVYLLSATGEGRRVSHTNDELISQIRLGDVEYVHFKSKDGTTVAGYITKPPDYQAGGRGIQRFSGRTGARWSRGTLSSISAAVAGRQRLCGDHAEPARLIRLWPGLQQSHQCGLGK